MKHETKTCPRCEIEMEAWSEYQNKNVRTWWQCEECGYATEISVHPKYGELREIGVLVEKRGGKGAEFERGG